MQSGGQSLILPLGGDTLRLKAASDRVGAGAGGICCAGTTLPGQLEDTGGSGAEVQSIGR